LELRDNIEKYINSEQSPPGILPKPNSKISLCDCKSLVDRTSFSKLNLIGVRLVKPVVKTLLKMRAQFIIKRASKLSPSGGKSAS
jgi:hypothetical protein